MVSQIRRYVAAGLRRSRFVRTLVCAAVLMAGAMPAARGQGPGPSTGQSLGQAGAAQPPAQPPAQAKSQSQSATRPAETQPSLTVDRDPVRSPDPDETGAATTVEGAQPKKSGKGAFTFRTDVDEVVLNATVIDQNGHLVSSLDKDAFRVVEDGVAQTIGSLRREDIPVSLGILVDNSGSMMDKRSAVNKAALDLVKSSNPQDEVFIVNFSDEAFLDQDFTSDVKKLGDGLSHLESKGPTALYDALVAAADHLAQGAKRPKQVLLVITDGEDTASSATLEYAVRKIQDLQGPLVYSIGLLYDEDHPKLAKRVLQTLSNETGGMAFFPKSLNEVDSVAAEVAQDIRNQYTIGYHSSKPQSVAGYRQVRVEAKAKGYGKLTVRTRSGYYPRASKVPQKASGQ